MTVDYVTLGTTPVDEPCAQVGSPDYIRQAQAECVRFIDLLRDRFGPEPLGARLGIKRFSHDFGDYIEVVCHYDTEETAAAEYAFRLEDELPERWA
jgi:hypothetical protein